MTQMISIVFLYSGLLLGISDIRHVEGSTLDNSTIQNTSIITSTRPHESSAANTTMSTAPGKEETTAISGSPPSEEPSHTSKEETSAISESPPREEPSHTKPEEKNIPPRITPAPHVPLKHTGSPSATAIGIVVGCFLVLLAICLIFTFIIIRKKKIHSYSFELENKSPAEDGIPLSDSNGAKHENASPDSNKNQQQLKEVRWEPEHYV
ncbi:uncharacterized protein [Dendropsophus ebraccatus]|uniref:uncharacterized protein n=1 Tax=Dendropsophus ebraccatus TaxID=150705 RepID=UPI0038312DD0